MILLPSCTYVPKGCDGCSATTIQSGVLLLAGDFADAGAVVGELAQQLRTTVTSLVDRPTVLA